MSDTRDRLAEEFANNYGQQEWSVFGRTDIFTAFQEGYAAAAKEAEALREDLRDAYNAIEAWKTTDTDKDQRIQRIISQRDAACLREDELEKREFKACAERDAARAEVEKMRAIARVARRCERQKFGIKNTWAGMWTKCEKHGQYAFGGNWQDEQTCPWCDLIAALDAGKETGK